MVALDLAEIPVVDNHCHAVESQQAHTDVADFRGLFTEAPDPQMRREAAADTAFYRRLLRDMAAFHGLDTADEQAILDARARLSTTELVGALFRDAGLGALVIDTGFPPAADVVPPDALRAAGGAPQSSLLRLELLFQDLVARCDSYDDLVADVTEQLAGIRDKGFAGFKSIAGYRTGLAIERWTTAQALASFAGARQVVAATGAVRLGFKPLLDSLLHLAFRAAAAQQLPVQFHVGYGDPDVDLRTASPLLLRAVLEEPAYRDMPVVLLHGCWPYVREGGYLAAVYGNAYLDLSYAIPFLSVGEMTAMTRAALGVAPIGKLMYSSDGARVPELHWSGARYGRKVLARCLAELVADGDLEASRAQDAGARILGDTARAVYGIT